MEPVEIVELVDGVPATALAPLPRDAEPRGHRRVLAVAAAVALVLVFGVLAATRPHAPAPAAAAPTVTSPFPFPSGPPPYRSGAPVYQTVDPELVQAVCPVGGCSAYPLTIGELRRYIAPLGLRPQAYAGAKVISPEGSVVGQLAEVDLPQDVSIALAVFRTAATPPLFQQTRTPEGSSLTLAAQRGGWTLTASLTFDGVVAVPVGEARDWLAQAALPDAAS